MPTFKQLAASRPNGAHPVGPVIPVGKAPAALTGHKALDTQLEAGGQSACAPDELLAPQKTKIQSEPNTPQNEEAQNPQ